MSGSGHHTFNELCELADLDVLGLLDEVDQAAFERGFDLCTPLEQDRLRERQGQLVTRLLATDDPKHAPEAPPEELRVQVVERILRENERLEASLAPLARIGRRRRDRSQRPALPDPTLQLRQAARSASIWRAASFALMVSLLASLVAGFWTSRDSQEAARLASQQLATEQLKERFGVDLETMLLASADQHVLGLSTEIANNGAMTVKLDRSKNTVSMVVFGMKPGDYFIDYSIDGKRNKIPFRIDHWATVVTMDAVPDGLASTLASSTWSITDRDGNVVARCNPTISA